jgi:hypothetical protein
MLLLKALQILLALEGIFILVNAIKLSGNQFFQVFIGSGTIIVAALFSKIKGLEDD